MNDRFASQLRQHLLSTADERAADGQLAAVVERVAVTPQRPRLVARLTWFPGRVGSLPARTVRYGLVAAAVIAAMVFAAVLYVGSNPARSTVFEGTWTSTDPGDGSGQSLVVGGGTTPSVEFVDHHASGEACVDDAVKVFTAIGRGTVTGNRLDVSWPNGGGCGLLIVDIRPGSYAYVEATDTIVDGQGLTWYRASDGVVPTRGPVTEPTVTPTSFPVDPSCLDLARGGVYSRRVGSLYVTMDVPRNPQTPWQGSHDQFSLSGSCLSGSSIDIQASIVTTVHADACDPASGVAITSYAEAVQQLRAQRGHAPGDDSGHGPTVGRFPATWFEIPFAGAACQGLSLWNGAGMSEGSALAYLIDVDGTTLGILLRYRDETVTGGQRDEAETIVYSLHVDTGLTPGATDPVVAPQCTDLEPGATYTRTVGSLPVSVTMPGAPSGPWNGLRDEFALQKAQCDGSGMPLIEAAVVDSVYADACHWEGTAVDTPTTADVVAALKSIQGLEISEPIEMTLGAYPATRIDFSIAPDADPATCDGDAAVFRYRVLFGDQVVVRNTVKRIYVVDGDGVTLAIAASFYPEELGATDLAEVDEILGTLRLGG